MPILLAGFSCHPESHSKRVFSFVIVVLLQQTSYADMLDLAVQHIKGLQTQVQVSLCTTSTSLCVILHFLQMDMLYMILEWCLHQYTVSYVWYYLFLTSVLHFHHKCIKYFGLRWSFHQYGHHNLVWEVVCFLNIMLF